MPPPPPPPKKSSKLSAAGQHQQPYPPSFPPPPLQSAHFPAPQIQQPPPVPHHFKPPQPIQAPPPVIETPSIVETPKISSVLPEPAGIYPPSFPPPPLQSAHFPAPQIQQPPPAPHHFKPPQPIQAPPPVIQTLSIVEAPKISSVLPGPAGILAEVALDALEVPGGDDREDTPPVTAKTYDAFDEEYKRPSLDFDKFIAEESSTVTAPKIKKLHKKLFGGTKAFSYNCLVMIVGFPFIILWGLSLGITSFIMNWVYIPFLKIVSWILNATVPVLGPLRNCCKPLMELVAVMCKR